MPRYSHYTIEQEIQACEDYLSGVLFAYPTSVGKTITTGRFYTIQNVINIT